MNIIKKSYKRIDYCLKKYITSQDKQNYLFCVLVRTNCTCGICSYAHQYLNAAFKAIKNGYFPIIDMKSRFYHQFHDKKHIKINVWDDYFKQPFTLDISEHYIKYKFSALFDLDSASIINRSSISKTFLTPSSVQNLIDEYLKKIIIDKTLGILIRGGIIFLKNLTIIQFSLIYMMLLEMPRKLYQNITCQFFIL